MTRGGPGTPLPGPPPPGVPGVPGTGRVEADQAALVDDGQPPADVHGGRGDDPAAVQHGDGVAPPGRREAVRDDHGGAAVQRAVEGSLHGGLGLAVQVGGGLVQHDRCGCRVLRGRPLGRVVGQDLPDEQAQADQQRQPCTQGCGEDGQQLAPPPRLRCLRGHLRRTRCPSSRPGSRAGSGRRSRR